MHYVAIGQSGFRHDSVRLGSLLGEYRRALLMLAVELGANNRQTAAYCHTTKFALPSMLICRLFGIG